MCSLTHSVQKECIHGMNFVKSFGIASSKHTVQVFGVWEAEDELDEELDGELEEELEELGESEEEGRLKLKHAISSFKLCPDNLLDLVCIFVCGGCGGGLGMTKEVGSGGGIGMFDESEEVVFDIGVYESGRVNILQARLFREECLDIESSTVR
jgi:hypothetical protein